MTIATTPLTVADSISKIAVSGVNMKDVDEIPDSASMLLPVVFPQPSGFITDIVPESMSFGSMGTQKENVLYTLNYVFLFAEVGSGLGEFAPYNPMMTSLTLVINAILNNDTVTGLVDMQLNGINGVGSVEDPSGKMYWGALFSVRCLEYAQ